MLGPAAMMGAAANEAVGTGGGGPSGPPTSVSIYKYGANLTGVQWTHGATSASTQIGDPPTIGGPPSSVDFTVIPLVTTKETDKECSCYWFVRHAKNEQFSAWVLATGCDTEDCPE